MINATVARPPKDRIKEPLSNGYRDFLLNLRMPSGMIVEVQMHLKKMLIAREHEKVSYDVARAIKASMEEEGREDMTPAEAEACRRARKASERIYARAWEECQAREGKREKGLLLKRSPLYVAKGEDYEARLEGSSGLSGVSQTEDVSKLSEAADLGIGAGLGKSSGIPLVSPGRSMQKAGRNYVKITYNAATQSGGSKRVTDWAEKLGEGRYRKITFEGDTTNTYILLGKGDLIEERPAQMNNHYGQLETKKVDADEKDEKWSGNVPESSTGAAETVMDVAPEYDLDPDIRDEATKAVDPVIGALQRLGGDRRYVSFDQLGPAAGLSPQALYAELRNLQRAGKVTLSGVEGRGGISPEQARWYVPDPGGRPGSLLSMVMLKSLLKSSPLYVAKFDAARTRKPAGKETLEQLESSLWAVRGGDGGYVRIDGKWQWTSRAAAEEAMRSSGERSPVQQDDGASGLTLSGSSDGSWVMADGEADNAYGNDGAKVKPARVPPQPKDVIGAYDGTFIGTPLKGLPLSRKKVE